MAVPTIETERFFLRPAVPEDAQGFFELDSDPEVHRYLGKKPVKSLEECHRVIEWLMHQYESYHTGRWVIEDKASGEFIGWAGLKFVREETNGMVDFYDVGYRLRKKFWGRGIAYECAKASVRYGFVTLGLKEIFAAADAENGASIRILEKCGFGFEGRFLYDGSVHNWYRLDALSRAMRSTDI